MGDSILTRDRPAVSNAAKHDERVLIDNLQVGILAEDADRRIVLANQEFCRIFGVPVPPEALIGYDCGKAAEDSKHLVSDPEAFVRRIADLMKSGESVRGEEIHLVDGRLLERDHVALPLGPGKIRHVWQYRDVTWRKAR